MGGLCSARLLGPLLRHAASGGPILEALPAQLRDAGSDDRVPVDLLHASFDRAAEAAGDEQLGLTLGRSMSLGELGVTDYLLRSAPSTARSVESAIRYARLHSDSYHVTWERRGDGGLLRMFDDVAWSRTVADMSMSSAYKLHVGNRTPFVSGIEAWFPHAAPADVSRYERCFPGATLRFGAPFHAFAIEGSYGDAPQPGADPTLHGMLRERLDAVMADLAVTSTMRHRVRTAIERQMREEVETSAKSVARALHMSRRTLSRRLGAEGSSFAAELDRVRQSLARSYVCASERPFAEVAYLLGFAHVESFHRAFKRWTGMTPLAQRTAIARSAGAAPVPN